MSNIHQIADGAEARSIARNAKKFMTIKTGLVMAALGLLMPGTSQALHLSQTLQNGIESLLLGANIVNGVTITNAPVSQTVNAGATVTLSVGASGPSLQYQWLLNGMNVPGATQPTLLVTNVQADVCGDYQVIVYNALYAQWSGDAFVQMNVPTLPFENDFSSRAAISGTNGSGKGTVVGAVTDPADPRPSSGRIFNNVWLKWTAPVTGPAHFDTIGSSIDSWLGIYTGTALINLVLVAADDDSGGFNNSSLDFNATAGTTYQIMVGTRDGFAAPIMLNWKNLPSAVPMPVITAGPTNLTTTFGSAATLSVRFTSQIPATVQWYHNGQAIAGATQTNLVWSQLGLNNLGTYQVSVTTPLWTVFSQPADIQFNSEGLTTVVAQHKLSDAVNTGLVGK